MHCSHSPGPVVAYRPQQARTRHRAHRASIELRTYVPADSDLTSGATPSTQRYAYQFATAGSRWTWWDRPAPSCRSNVPRFCYRPGRRGPVLASTVQGSNLFFFQEIYKCLLRFDDMQGWHEYPEAADTVPRYESCDPRQQQILAPFAGSTAAVRL